MKSLLDLLPEMKGPNDEGHVLFHDGYNKAIRDVIDNLSSIETVRVYGRVVVKDNPTWDHFQESNDTHTALLFAITPIKKGVSKDELLAWFRKGEVDWKSMKELADRIEREGIAE